MVGGRINADHIFQHLAWLCNFAILPLLLDLSSVQCQSFIIIPICIFEQNGIWIFFVSTTTAFIFLFLYGYKVHLLWRHSALKALSRGPIFLDTTINWLFNNWMFLWSHYQFHSILTIAAKVCPIVMNMGISCSDYI